MPHSKDLGMSYCSSRLTETSLPYSFTVSVSNFLGKHTLPKHVVHMDLTDSCRNLDESRVCSGERFRTQEVKHWRSLFVAHNHLGEYSLDIASALGPASKRLRCVVQRY